MTRDELRSLKVGDRVRLDQPGGSVFGTVVDRLRGCPKIAWEGSGSMWVLNPRAKHERDRVEIISKVESQP